MDEIKAPLLSGGDDHSGQGDSLQVREHLSFSIYLILLASRPGEGRKGNRVLLAKLASEGVAQLGQHFSLLYRTLA